MTDEEAIKEIIGSGYGREQCHEETMRRAEDALRERIERKNGGWISVKDRLPNLPNLDYCSRYVIATDGKSSFPRQYERILKRGKRVERWLMPWDRISDEKITHWREFPEPPKEEQK